MRLWQVWLLLLLGSWLAVAVAVYMTAQAAYVVIRLASILTIRSG